MKDDVIIIRVTREFKSRIMSAIKNRKDYSITRVLVDGAETILKKLAREEKKDRSE